VINQRGMLADIAREVTLSEANIDNIQMTDKDAHHAVISITLEVKNRIHLAQILKRIRILTGVEKVIRLKS
jgi:guanosine-3',5'-bis(diphosphate) 3'-pyrophosphohydrolase